MQFLAYKDAIVRYDTWLDVGTPCFLWVAEMPAILPQVAHFFAEMGRAIEATQMYETILAQPASVLNASPASRHQVSKPCI